MTCDQARESLWPDPDAFEAGAAHAHYLICPDCHRFFAVQQRLGRRLAAIPPDGAPALLLARVRLGMAEARRPRRRLWWTLGVAAAVVLVASLVLRPADPTAAFAPAANHLAQMPMEGDTADLEAASAWLSERLAMPLALPDIPGADFMGADLLTLDGTTWAGARYRFKGMTLAYFARPDDGKEPDSTMLSGQSGGWVVTTWTEIGGMRALAGARPLTSDEVLALASDCRTKAAMQAPRSS